MVTGIVTKCLNGRPKTKEGGILISLMFIEIEQFATVQVRHILFVHVQHLFSVQSSILFTSFCVCARACVCVCVFLDQCSVT